MAYRLSRDLGKHLGKGSRRERADADDYCNWREVGFVAGDARFGSGETPSQIKAFDGA